MDPSRYLDLFVAESREHLARAAGLAAALDGDPDETALRETFRHFHSIKGMAATMGFATMRDLAHAAEGVLEACRRGTLARAEGGALVGEAAARLEYLLDRAARGESPGEPIDGSLTARLRTLAEQGGVSDPSSAAAPAARPPARAETRSYRVGCRIDRDRPFPALRTAALLGRIGRLGRVVASTPPPAALRSGRCDGTLGVTLETSLEPTALGAALARLEELESFTVVPVDPAPALPPRPAAPWTRLPVTAVDAWLSDATELVRLLSRAQADPRAVALARRLRRRAVDARLVPFEPLAGRLERAAGDLGRGLGKEVALAFDGRDTQVDRVLLDALADPLLHLVRNAVDHGIESPVERATAGKPAHGTIRLTLRRRAAVLDVTVDDDGRGVDAGAVRREAVTRGFASPAVAEVMDDPSSLALLLEPGFSTARRTGVVSGRGVGLDVVAEAVAALGGRLALEARPGLGLRVKMSFPFATARIQVVVVRSGGARLALPATAVRRARPAEGDAAISLAEALGGSTAAPGPIVIEIEGPRGPRAFGVDAVEGRQELVVRPIRGPLDACGTYAASGVLDDGAAILVLDPEAL